MQWKKRETDARKWKRVTLRRLVRGALPLGQRDSKKKKNVSSGIRTRDYCITSPIVRARSERARVKDNPRKNQQPIPKSHNSIPASLLPSSRGGGCHIFLTVNDNRLCCPFPKVEARGWKWAWVEAILTDIGDKLSPHCYNEARFVSVTFCHLLLLVSTVHSLAPSLLLNLSANCMCKDQAGWKSRQLRWCWDNFGEEGKWWDYSVYNDRFISQCLCWLALDGHWCLVCRKERVDDLDLKDMGKDHYDEITEASPNISPTLPANCTIAMGTTHHHEEPCSNDRVNQCAAAICSCGCEEKKLVDKWIPNH